MMGIGSDMPPQHMLRSMRLEGRRALVTGGASGIGAEIARRLTAEGATVVIGDLNVDGAEKVAQEIGAAATMLDVADPGSAASAVNAHGPFQILVNNAGTDDFAFFTEMTPERWSRLIAINLEGVFAAPHAVLPAMQEAGYGRIVNIASEAGRVGSKGSAVYSAAKGGVIAFTKAIARENARYGITANAIAPGPINTPLLRRGRRLATSASGSSRRCARQPRCAGWEARGGRGRGGVPGLRRRLVRDRGDARRLRRPGDGLVHREGGRPRGSNPGPHGEFERGARGARPASSGPASSRWPTGWSPTSAGRSGCASSRPPG